MGYVNPLNPPDLGTFKKLGDNPKRPAEGVLHLFLGCLLYIIYFYLDHVVDFQVIALFGELLVHLVD